MGPSRLLLLQGALLLDPTADLLLKPAHLLLQLADQVHHTLDQRQARVSRGVQESMAKNKKQKNRPDMDFLFRSV